MKEDIRDTFANFQTVDVMQIKFLEIENQQPPDTSSKENSATTELIAYNTKHKISKAIDINFYFSRDRPKQDFFCGLWYKGSKNLDIYITKHQLAQHNKTMILIYLYTLQIDDKTTTISATPHVRVYLNRQDNGLQRTMALLVTQNNIVTQRVSLQVRACNS